MARKTLLTESELRRFMKLATISPLGANRLEEMGYGNDPIAERDEEEELDAELHATEDELGAEDEWADEEEGELDDLEAADVADEELPPEGEDEMSLSDEEAEAIIDLADRLRAAMGGDEGDEGEEEIEDEVELDADVEGPEGGEEEIALDAEEEELVPGMRDAALYENSDALVDAVAKKVAARLSETNKREQMVDQLAERIMQRLTK